MAQEIQSSGEDEDEGFESSLILATDKSCVAMGGETRRGNPEDLEDMRELMVPAPNKYTYAVDLDTHEYVHWARGSILSNTNKSIFWRPIADQYTHEMWKDHSEGGVLGCSATVADVCRVCAIMGLPLNSLSLGRPLEQVIATMPTCGKHFYIGCEQLTMKQLDQMNIISGKNSYENLKVAFHGTALANIVPGLKNGIEPGKNHFENLYGVYCEREARQSSVWNYMTHQNLDPENPNHFYAAQWELLVDRSGGVGRTHHSQWIQPKNSVVQVAVIIHVFNILDIFTATPEGGNYSGWFRVHDPCLTKLRPTTEAKSSKHQ